MPKTFIASRKLSPIRLVLFAVDLTVIPKWAEGMKGAGSTRIKAVATEEIGMFPPCWRDMAEILIRNLLSLGSERCNCMTKIHSVPGNDGRHKDVKSTRPMHLILERSIAKLTSLSKE
jgi:hypothetical protein